MIEHNNEKSLDYYEQRDKDGDLVYEMDILYERTTIFSVPIEYRTRTAYIYACRSIRGKSEGYLFTAIPLLKAQLLDDIREWYRRGAWEKAQDLRSIYWSYFHSCKHFYCSEADMFGPDD